MISKSTADLLGRLPKPILRSAAKLLINSYLDRYAKVTVAGREKLRSIKGPVIFISNHLSNSDGLVLNRVLNRKDVWFVAGVKLSKNSLTKIGLEAINFISISPDSADKSAISEVIGILKAGNSICMFPEGTRSRQGSLLKGKRGILLIAKMAGTPIVPIGLEGTEILMPINDDDMGKEKFQKAHVKVTIGDSFYLPEKEKEEDRRIYEQRALHYTMRRIAELLPVKYQGVYEV